MESIVPIFQVKSLDEVLQFYQALGFEITYRQDRPYIYAAVQRGGINIHFTKGTGTAHCLVHVNNVEEYHKAFAQGLRTKYGKVPTTKTPRMTRFKQGQTRFTVYDPLGNTLLFINHDEPDMDYDAYDEHLSPLLQALENVKFLRDTYHDDKSAAQFLDKKLQQHSSAPPIERARALAARAELAVAMHDHERLQIVRDELRQIHLTDEERSLYQDELSAADQLEQWLVEKNESGENHEPLQ
jgi:catechol 2,3-dioxygenase-like lactoylglutathione lyase family enzyme